MSTLWNFTSLGLENPTSGEFVYSPQNHVIAAFALGAVFLLSLYYILRSIGHSLLGARLRRYVNVLPGEHAHVNSQELPEDRVRDWLVNTLGGAAGVAVYNPNSDIKSVGALMSLSITIGSAMLWGSLMTFPMVKGGSFACQFVVATGYIAVGMTRAKGLYKMSTEMVELGVPKWETIVFRVCILLSMVGMVIWRYFSTGVLVMVSTAVPYAMCYNRHFILPAAIITVANLFLEIYALVRLFVLLSPSFLSLSHRLCSVCDIRIFWALALIFFELCTAVGNIYPLGLVVDFVPYSLSGMILLIVFNYRRAPPRTLPTATLGPLSTFHASQYDRSSVRHSAFVSEFDPGAAGYENFKQKWEAEELAGMRPALPPPVVQMSRLGERRKRNSAPAAHPSYDGKVRGRSFLML
ncbi:hypothetical protein DACRYDRAFT_23011 [Dacryopinax primogenitus]|uniref:Uncharacterized protein n=1 Tax=Dacryopinax primogenitus (strain DJM 731) TaxID=1858805 RepID=M5FXP2_DACPD|nr:uncharacterized protein DACRYDRAFT_23011 [Dacryopinax primogenitus]EJU00555.1 hypothetical protein DACRYDRAFT_23011 [Dacryopinax primogenitus]